MSVIVPAILPATHKDLEHKLAALYGIVDSVQIDVVDGKFATPASWPYTENTEAFSKTVSEGTMLPYVGKMHFEIDIMVEDPEALVGTWINAGADRITLHVESTRFLPRMFNELEVKFGFAKDFAPNLLSLGLALNIDTDIALIDPFIEKIEYVQFMGIRTVGRQGEPFDATVLRKIDQFKRKYSNTAVQVDGGVSLETAPALLSAGVDRLIIGSAFWNAEDLPAQYEKFKDLLEGRNL